MELLHCRLVVHVIARCKANGVGLEKLHYALTERHVTIVDGVVQETSGKITEMDMHGIGLRFHAVHHIDVRRFGVCLEARSYCCNVDKIVGLVYYKFRHTHIVLHTYAHEVELGAFG